MQKLLLLPIVVLLCLLFSGKEAMPYEKRGSDKKEARPPTKKCIYGILTWDAPTTNTDGSPLTDLKGYSIYYRCSPKDKYKPLNKDMPLILADEEDLCKEVQDRTNRKKCKTVCSYDITDLEGGPCSFAVRAVNKAGKESDDSNEVEK
jgi:hypothetical protein